MAITAAVSAANRSTAGRSTSGNPVPPICAGTPQKLSSQIDQMPLKMASINRPLPSMLSANTMYINTSLFLKEMPECLSLSPVRLKSMETDPLMGSNL